MLRPSFFICHLLLAIAAVNLAPRVVGNAAETVDFFRDVQPILKTHCFDCHGENTQESGLRLDRRSNMLRGGDLGVPSIVPGNPGLSFVVDVIASGGTGDNLGSGKSLRMPPDGPPLPEDQVTLLREWIRQGALWPGQMEVPSDRVRSNHWAFQRVASVEVPSTDHIAWANGSIENPIDAFVAQRLQEAGLKWRQVADRATLLRRLSLDLTGLPPSQGELLEFQSAESDHDAWAAVIDRKLAAPAYGERWAQHWMDVIRWAETVGFETNLARTEAYHYRDWLVAALNDDLPYDQFVLQQLAGDTITEAKLPVDAALGFLTAGPANLPGQIGRDEMAMRQARQDELDEVIKTVSQGFLGLTIGCARCHNHKFDPISQRDYYSLQAVFSGLEYGNRRLRGEQNDRWTSRLPAAREKVARLEERREQLRLHWELQRPLVSVNEEKFDAVLARAVRMKIKATQNGGPASLWELEAWATADKGSASRNVALTEEGAKASASSFALANQSRHHDNLNDGRTDRRQAFGWAAASKGEAWAQIDFGEPAPVDKIVWHEGYSVPVDYEIELLDVKSNRWERVADATRRMLRIDDGRGVRAVHLVGTTEEAVREIIELGRELRGATAELARLEAGPQTYAATFRKQPPPTHLLVRGDPMQKSIEVFPAVPEILQSAESQPAVREAAESGIAGGELGERQRRLMLTQHIVDPNHPLTSRVIVNRVWQHHFGIGLVETPSDFGKMGSEPSHPELLDWLAGEFVRNGWSLKWLHRQIVTSRTYRQGSSGDAASERIDLESRLLWRFPPRRQSAEAIRDSILFVSGHLNRQMGGRGFDFFNQRGGLSDYVAIQEFQPSGWRRMVYAHKIRMQSVDVFGQFDCPDAGQLQPKRPSSITPVQAMGLLNSPFVNRQAERFANRVRKQLGDQVDTESQVRRCIELALQRPGDTAEVDLLVALADEHGLVSVCRVLFNSSEFVYLR